MGVVTLQSCCTHSEDAKRPPGWAVWCWRRWTCPLVSPCLSPFQNAHGMNRLSIGIQWIQVLADLGARQACCHEFLSGVQSGMSARFCHIHMLHAVEL